MTESVRRNGRTMDLDVAGAWERVRPHVRRTPVLTGELDGLKPRLKCEFLQHTGSFKARGAFNRIVSMHEAGHLEGRDVVAASGGNAGMAVAHAASTIGVAAHVYVPTTASRVKLDKLKSLGATVHTVGEQYADAYEAAAQAVNETGAVFCHAYDQPEIVAGQGTIALELHEQVPDLDTVVVACGGGGLMGGLLAGLASHVTVVAVEPVESSCLHAAIAAGQPVDVPVSGIAADSLGARRLGQIAWSLVADRDVVSVTVTDAQIVAARRALWADYRIAAEPGGATAWAGLLAGAYRPARDETVAVIVCGANTDPSDLAN